MSWSGEISVSSGPIFIPNFMDGAIIDVSFKCGKCGAELEACVDLPTPCMGADTEAESERYGDPDNVECENCGENYEVIGRNTIHGWMVDFESDNPPKTFRYKVYRDNSAPEEDES